MCVETLLKTCHSAMACGQRREAAAGLAVCRQLAAHCRQTSKPHRPH